MEITLSQYAGFCEGVERAYDIVEKIAKDPKVKRPIFVLGSLVHNEDVVEKIEKMGIQKVHVEGPLEDFFEKIKNEVGTLVITAHGIGPQIYELAKKYEVDLVDTTCPRVVKVQRLAKAFFDRDVQVVIIGEKNHKEVKGIFEWANKKAIFIETDEDLCGFDVDPAKKIAVISQTTQDQEFVDRAAAQISQKYPKAEVVDSICLTTHHRQTEIKQLAQENDVVIVIGSPESANSKRLWEIAKRVNESSYFVQRASEIENKWFANCKKVAVTAGASTPKWIIDDVIAKLETWNT
ncbi:MAG: Hydroxymethylbutenyl pyrophosphate reductase [Candidatus Moranbacteria bacterium GW2011_GWC2_37_73]|nr:MAG: Hydroxymethylbutenyl pyrophosphate reductase [Parcubacteria group bacterium GW2011_GWC1_36_108]KKQ00568.1 MAG: Hydroxymethylbutenyl pyrophosphate reductase [Candidatus Moranbacteria bacterium GW2011_GWD1_36_198]KKQ01832.1 MAG: Hydroxymethylbutenyl pyrophosphate reductase [Candidatus Moranbacteria bacterium GW2011_GWD2_36_198]KKQ40440.1 MAG: Hydroxymethylbutenyl pyrophosphate reductase [Candidatus Moranbacteria bacterium GW2011_GWC2_37_73]HAS00127.1 4-hydroxy-3-methylbut-2-enyl diphospha